MERDTANISQESKKVERILTFLHQQSISQTALQISKGIGLETAKQVNPVLYSLEKKGLVVKAQKNAKVLWQIANMDVEMVPETSKMTDNETTEGFSVVDNLQEEPEFSKLMAEPYDGHGDGRFSDAHQSHLRRKDKTEEMHAIDHGKRGHDHHERSNEIIGLKYPRDNKTSHAMPTREFLQKPIQDQNDHKPIMELDSDSSMKTTFTSPEDLKGGIRPCSSIGRGELLRLTCESTTRKTQNERIANVPGLASKRSVSDVGKTSAPILTVPKAPHELLRDPVQETAELKRFSRDDHGGSQGHGSEYSDARYIQMDIGLHDTRSSAQTNDAKSCQIPFLDSDNQHNLRSNINIDRSSLEPLNDDQLRRARLPPLIVDDESHNNPEIVKRKILKFLNEFHRPVATLEIAKAVNKKTKKEVNSVLYAMMREGLLVKATEQPPSWKVVRESSSNESDRQADFQSHGGHATLYQPTRDNQQSAAMTRVARQQSWPSNARENDDSRVNVAQESEYRYQQPCESLQSPMNPSSHSSSRVAHESSSATQMSPPKIQGFSEVGFAALSKNPVSALNEYVQKNQMNLSFEVLNEGRGVGRNKFLMACCINGKMFNAVSAPNMKEARREAADVAMRELLSQQLNNPAKVSSSIHASESLPHFDQMAMLCHDKFIKISAGIQEKFAGRKVIAGIVMKTYNDATGTVVSIGTGNRCITGDRLSLEGRTVNDSHAEIVCRRAFLLFLYSELDKFYSNYSSIFEEGGLDGRAQIKDGITFHLYISTAPCGDAALFSPRESTIVNTSNLPHEHSPTFTSKQQGLLRTKIEDGEGTIPIDPNDGPQTFDGIKIGKRLRTMSCTDKVCKWNVLGLQGALLSHLTDPVYLESITLGYLYDHGHMSRGVCCRLNHQSQIDKNLPMPFFLNHPWLGRITSYNPPRETEKTNNLSVNWYHGCDSLEITDGPTGSCMTRTENAPTPSRLCKAALFSCFKQICARNASLQNLLRFETYREIKEHAASFQRAKYIMNDQFKRSKFGSWVRKPRELELFSV